MEKIKFPMNRRWIILRGNPVDGFEFIGPFVSTDEANDWAEHNDDPELAWWIAKLARP